MRSGPLRAGTASLDFTDGVDLDAVIAELDGLAGGRRHGIYRLSRKDTIRVETLETTLDPDVNDFLSRTLGSAASDFAGKVWGCGMPFSWTFTPGRPESRRANSQAQGCRDRIADLGFHVFFRRCCAAERLVYICQSRAGGALLDDRALVYGHGLAQLVFDALLQCEPARTVTAPHITTREKECLRWCAEGKTSEEIGIILALSTHTVNHYLISATKKLNAVNRMHAITVAIRHGMLDINEMP